MALPPKAFVAIVPKPVPKPPKWCVSGWLGVQQALRVARVGIKAGAKKHVADFSADVFFAPAAGLEIAARCPALSKEIKSTFRLCRHGFYFFAVAAD